MIADQDKSRYFPINNAYFALKLLTFAGRSSNLDPDNCPHCQPNL